MEATSLVLAAIALGMLAVVAFRQPDAVRPAIGRAIRGFFVILPRFAVALIAAGFIGKLLPGELIASVIGPESGYKGILVASVLGGFVPGGPMISFPIVVVLRDVGAGLPQLIAFLTAWSALAIHRVLIYESALMGWRFSATRLSASVLLAPLAGTATALIVQVWSPGF